MKVNALIGGTQKGGTTALFDFLSGHPHVGIPRNGVKEVHFFDNELNFKLPGPRYGEYERQFQAAPDAQILLEATPIYLFWEPVAERISKYNPQMKFIFILRDPVARAYSQWEMEFSRGSEIESFERALELEQEFTANSPNRQHRIRSYLSRSYYGMQVRKFLEYFDRNQIQLLRNDELLEDHEGTLDIVCDFLGLHHFSTYPSPRLVLPTQKDSTLPKLSSTLAESLRGRFQEDLLELRRLSGMNVKDWLG